MFLRQFVLPSLGHASYLVGDPGSGEAVLVDPRRDVGPYLEAARGAGLRVVYVLDTHGHNDYLSGVGEVLGWGSVTALGFERAGLGYPHRALEDGDEVALGGLTLRLLHLPGHTPEHAGLLVSDDGADRPELLLSGGALLAGSVGRPDLLGGPEEAREGALALHRTLHQRLAWLPDALPAVPPHWRRLRPRNLAGPPPLARVRFPGPVASVTLAREALGARWSLTCAARRRSRPATCPGR